MSKASPKEIGNLCEKLPMIDFSILVENEEDIEVVCSLDLNRNPNCKLQIIPLYNTRNNSFIFKTLAVNEDDLLINGPDKNNIFVHESINIFDFGKLYIMPDGKIYSNMCGSAIGTILDTPKDVIYKELTEGRSWLNTRVKSNCNKCVFKLLCPSPSNYETLLGCKLCTISQ